MNQQGLHCIVSGRVQGVFYRAATQRKAAELGITGWVRNLSGGEVEVLAFGTLEQLQILQKWLWQGPPAAKVNHVESKEVDWQSYTDFSIQR